MQITRCGWEFVFLQNLCRTRGSLDQILVVLSQNSLDWALSSTCLCGSLHEELFASSCTSGGCFLVFFITLESGTRVAHLLFRGILTVVVKVECGYSSGIWIYLQGGGPFSRAGEMWATFSESLFLKSDFLAWRTSNLQNLFSVVVKISRVQ